MQGRNLSGPPLRGGFLLCFAGPERPRTRVPEVHFPLRLKLGAMKLWSFFRYKIPRNRQQSCLLKPCMYLSIGTDRHVAKENEIWS